VHTRCLELLAASPAYDSLISLGTINASSAFWKMSGDESGVDEETIKMRRWYLKEMGAKFSQRIIELMQEYDKPIVTVGMPQRESDVTEMTDFPQDKLCIYTNPERAARVAAMLAERGEYLRSRGV
jgi:hypothetical protein